VKVTVQTLQQAILIKKRKKQKKGSTEKLDANKSKNNLDQPERTPPNSDNPDPSSEPTDSDPQQTCVLEIRILEIRGIHWRQSLFQKAHLQSKDLKILFVITLSDKLHKQTGTSKKKKAWAAVSHQSQGKPSQVGVHKIKYGKGKRTYHLNPAELFSVELTDFEHSHLISFNITPWIILGPDAVPIIKKGYSIGASQSQPAELLNTLSSIQIGKGKKLLNKIDHVSKTVTGFAPYPAAGAIGFEIFSQVEGLVTTAIKYFKSKAPYTAGVHTIELSGHLQNPQWRLSTDKTSKPNSADTASFTLKFGNPLTPYQFEVDMDCCINWV